MWELPLENKTQHLYNKHTKGRTEDNIQRRKEFISKKIF